MPSNDATLFCYPDVKGHNNSKRRLVTTCINNYTSNYTKVDYIESTGTQYIDTGVNPADTVDFELDFKTDYNHRSQSSADNNGSEAIFGYPSSTLNKVYDFNFGANVNKAYIFLWKNNTYANGASIINFSTNTYNPVNRIKVECKNDVWKVNGNTIGTSDSVGAWKDTSKTMYIGGVYYDSQIKPFYDPLYIYNCKMWDNGTLVRNFEPCIRNSDGKPGLYDTVNDVFYTNAGSGEFVIP